MDITVHSLAKLIAGDTWQFQAVINGPDGQPLDLTNVVVSWSMVNFNGIQMFTSTDYTIDTSGGNGQCSILVPGTSTTRIPSGSYSDFWRFLVDSDTPLTLVTGPMRVRADPFVAPHDWAFKGMTVQTGVKWNDSQDAMADRIQEKVVYDFTS